MGMDRIFGGRIAGYSAKELAGYPVSSHQLSVSSLHTQQFTVQDLFSHIRIDITFHLITLILIVIMSYSNDVEDGPELIVQYNCKNMNI